MSLSFASMKRADNFINSNDYALLQMERIAREVCGAVAPRDEVQRLRNVPARPPPPPLLPAPLPPATSLTTLPVRATLCPIERPAR